MNIDEVKSRIKEKAQLVEKSMRDILPNREPWSVYNLAWDFLERGGKRVRPYLMLTTIEGFNGNIEDGLEIAAGIEIFHNFTLIHDDIEDGSEMRRGKPCLHIMHGIALAINAGDGMFAYVFEALRKSKLPPEKKVKVLDMMAKAFIAVVDGQGYELQWIAKNRWDITEEMYFKMVGGKTGALIAASAEIGAYIGGASEEEIKAMWDYGYEAGLAFQIQDDVLNLVGEEEKYQKEIGGDIREGKRTLMVIRTLNDPKVSEEEKKELVRILSAKENTKEEIEKAIDIMKRSGSIEYAKEYAERLVNSAKERLKVVKNEKVREELEALADLFVRREK